MPRVTLRVPPGSSSEVYVTNYVRGHQTPGFEIESVDRIEMLPTCGLGALASIPVLAMIPVSMPARARAVITGRDDGRRVTRTYHLILSQQMSVWHWLVPPRRDDRMTARAILQAVDQEQIIPPVRR